MGDKIRTNVVQIIPIFLVVHKWYKYTINKRIIKVNNDKIERKKNRYNRAYYNGFVIDIISLFMIGYFPMQKC